MAFLASGPAAWPGLAASATKTKAAAAAMAAARWELVRKDMGRSSSKNDRHGALCKTAIIALSEPKGDKDRGIKTAPGNIP